MAIASALATAAARALGERDRARALVTTGSGDALANPTGGDLSARTPGREDVAILSDSDIPDTRGAQRSAAEHSSSTPLSADNL